MSESGATLRLDRLLANMGYGSRKDIQWLVKSGAVVLDGTTLRDASDHVPVSAELPTRLAVSGAPLDPPPGLVLALHKPLGVTCSHKEAGPLVYGLPQDDGVRRPRVSGGRRSCLF